jgi:hypothetical protein
MPDGGQFVLFNQILQAFAGSITAEFEIAAIQMFNGVLP